MATETTTKEATTVFRKLFESGFKNDFVTMAETISDDCEWVLMPDMNKCDRQFAVYQFSAT
jgi:hypothetical protein